MDQDDLIISTVVYPGTPAEIDVMLLFESIRKFAGALRNVTLWCFVPAYGKKMTPSIKNRLRGLNVTLFPFDVENSALHFPFFADARAAALAETRAENQTETLVWLSANTLVLQEPTAFLIPRNTQLAFRPVHHTLVGSPYDEPLDRFWKEIYRYCHVPDDHIFPMTTHVDSIIIRPYFNAGILVTRPKKRVLRIWYDTFMDAYQKDEFRELYVQDERYVIFMHQAILSGVILSLYHKDQLLELPRTYNYPLHLRDEDVTGHRPAALEELVTVRHEGFYKDPQWSAKMPASKITKTWLQTVLKTRSID
jgi:hypothetical protein